jgi:hypothetical protein
MNKTVPERAMQILGNADGTDFVSRINEACDFIAENITVVTDTYTMVSVCTTCAYIAGTMKVGHGSDTLVRLVRREFLRGLYRIPQFPIWFLEDERLCLSFITHICGCNSEADLIVPLLGLDRIGERPIFLEVEAPIYVKEYVIKRAFIYGYDGCHVNV